MNAVSFDALMIRSSPSSSLFSLSLLLNKLQYPILCRADLVLAMQTERRNKSIDIHQSACTTSTCLPLQVIYATEDRDERKRESERWKETTRVSHEDILTRMTSPENALIYTSYWQLELSTANGPTSSDIFSPYEEASSLQSNEEEWMNRTWA